MGDVDDAAAVDDVGSNRHWEDAIDVDDSDLIHLLSPSLPPPPSQILNPTAGPIPTLRPCSQAPYVSELLAFDFQEEEVEEEQIEAEAERRRETVAVGRRIPGPAGAIQAAMHRRSATGVPTGGSCLKEQWWGERLLAFEDEDENFELNPWLCALEFLGKSFGSVSPISSIESRTGDRVSQVVGIIKSCTPNGLGDFLLTLKDPTGCIGATVHHRALLEHNLIGDLSVGCVIILKQVVVFCPNRSVQYLNVTSSNLVKLFRNDCEPPNKQLPPMPSEKKMKTSLGTREKNLMQIGVVSPIDEEHVQNPAIESCLIAPHVIGRIVDKPGSEDIGSGLPVDAEIIGRIVDEPDSEDIGSGLLVDAESSTINSLPIRRKLNSQRKISGLEMNLDRDIPFSTVVSDAKEIRHLPGTDMDITLNVAVNPLETNAAICLEERQKGFNTESRYRRKDRFSGCPPDLHVDHNAASTVMHTKSDFRSHGAENTISKVSFAQWTDEQLMELFADYQDDPDLFQPHN